MYHLTVLSVFGCDSVLAQGLVVNQVYEAEISFDYDTLCTFTGEYNIYGTPLGGISSGAGVASEVFYPNSAGVGDHYIYYTFTSNDNCSHTDSSLVHVSDCLGLTDLHFPNLSIYPNPFKDQTVISFGRELDGQYDLIIYDMLGKQVYSEPNLSGDQIEIKRGEFSSGAYLVNLSNNQTGEVVFTSPLLVE
ncbi:MAG: hypothetical protein ACI857_003352 [Arenicella sp.]|jgi:hypothetical protein